MKVFTIYRFNHVITALIYSIASTCSWYQYSTEIITVVFRVTSCVSGSKFISCFYIFTEAVKYSSVRCCTTGVPTFNSVQDDRLSASKLLHSLHILFWKWNWLCLVFSDIIFSNTLFPEVCSSSSCNFQPI